MTQRSRGKDGRPETEADTGRKILFESIRPSPISPVRPCFLAESGGSQSTFLVGYSHDLNVFLNRGPTGEPFFKKRFDFIGHYLYRMK